MPSLLKMNKFRGMFSDPVDSKIPDNGFKLLYNWYLTRDKSLDKIPGYMRYTDYLFSSAVNNIDQLIRTEDRNIFFFDYTNIYREDISKNTTILKQNYPETQADEAGNRFRKVRSMAYANRIYAVDENLYPFLIYNLSDEAGVNLNIWAELLVTGADTITLVDANDNTLIYKTIILPAIENDGSNLVIKYNDGFNIYIFSDTWVYKFNYSNLTYDVVKSTKISTVAITDISFKDDSFAVAPDGKEYDYDFILKAQGSQLENFWYNGEARYVGGHFSIGNAFSLLGIEKFPAPNQWRWSYLINYFILTNSANINFSWDDLYGTTVNKNESDGQNVDLRTSPTGTNKYVIRTDASVTKIRQRNVLYTNITRKIRKTYFFREGNIIYVGSYIRTYFQYRTRIHMEYYDGTWKTQQDVDTGLQSTDQENEIVRKYDLNDDLNLVGGVETIADLETKIGNGEYDFIYINVATDDNVPDVVIDVDVQRETSGPPVVEYPQDPAYLFYPKFWSKVWVDNFPFKLIEDGQTTPELFYPYVTEYNADDWEVRMQGTPGRPYVLKQSSGSISGTYKFYVSYVTTLDTQSETFKSEPYQPPAFSTEKADVYWAEVPSDYYGFTFLGLRIYAEDSLGNIYLVAEVAEGGADWNAGHIVIDEIIPIISILNVKPYFPKMKINTMHLERYVMSGNPEAPNTYYFSAVGDPDNNPLTNNGTIRSQDKDAIVALTSIYDRMIVFKTNHVYAVVGDLATPQSVLTISSKYGCIAPDSVIVYKSTLAFLSYAGICLIDGNSLIEVTRGVLNKWIFKEHTEAELKTSFALFDVDKKEYRLYIGKEVLVFNLNNDFYIEKKYNGSHLCMSSAVTLDNNNEKEFLFGTTQNRVFKDRAGKHWNGQKRWAYAQTKKYKLSDFDEPEIFNLIRLNADLNSPLSIYSDRDNQVIFPEHKNYYESAFSNLSDETVQFNIYEKSEHDCKLKELELIYEP